MLSASLLMLPLPPRLARARGRFDREAKRACRRGVAAGGFSPIGSGKGLKEARQDRPARGWPATYNLLFSDLSSASLCELSLLDLVLNAFSLFRPGRVIGSGEYPSRRGPESACGAILPPLGALLVARSHTSPSGAAGLAAWRSAQSSPPTWPWSTSSSSRRIEAMSTAALTVPAA